MQISALYTTAQKIGQQARPQLGSEPDFAETLKQAASSPTASTSNRTNESKAASTEQDKKEAAQARKQALRDELQEYLNKSPAEHMRDAIMKEMGITEEELQAMPPEKREAIEADIARKMRERLLAKDEAHPDANTLQEATQATLTQQQGSNAGQQQGNGQNGDQSPAGMPAYTALMTAVNGKRSAG